MSIYLIWSLHLVVRSGHEICRLNFIFRSLMSNASSCWLQNIYFWPMYLADIVTIWHHLKMMMITIIIYWNITRRYALSGICWHYNNRERHKILEESIGMNDKVHSELGNKIHKFICLYSNGRFISFYFQSFQTACCHLVSMSAVTSSWSDLVRPTLYR